MVSLHGAGRETRMFFSQAFLYCGFTTFVISGYFLFSSPWLSRSILLDFPTAAVIGSDSDVGEGDSEGVYVPGRSLDLVETWALAWQLAWHGCRGEDCECWSRCLPPAAGT